MNTILRLSLAACLLVTSVAIADPVVGTWELNIAKSKFSPAGGLAPKSETRTYAESADGMTTLTYKTVKADGTEDTVSVTYKADGKDYPVKGSAAFDSISVKRINSHTVDFWTKKAGKTAITGRRSVSKDGTTLRLTATGTDKAGAKFEQTQVYDKK